MVSKCFVENFVWKNRYARRAHIHRCGNDQMSKLKLCTVTQSLIVELTSKTSQPQVYICLGRYRKGYILLLRVVKLTTLEILSCKPKTKFNSFPLNQVTEYVFCATARFSPPRLYMWKKTLASGHLLSFSYIHIAFYFTKQIYILTQR